MVLSVLFSICISLQLKYTIILVAEGAEEKAEAGKGTCLFWCDFVRVYLCDIDFAFSFFLMFFTIENNNFSC